MRSRLIAGEEGFGAYLIKFARALGKKASCAQWTISRSFPEIIKQAYVYVT